MALNAVELYLSCVHATLAFNKYQNNFKYFMTYKNNSFMFSRRTAIKFIAGAVGGIILHDMKPSVAQSSKMKMSLGGVTWIGLTPFYIAQEKGFFAENNLEVKLQIFWS